MEINLISTWEFQNCGFKLKFYYNALRRFYCRVLNEKDEQILPILLESQIYLESTSGDTDSLTKLNKFSSSDKFDLLVSKNIKNARISSEGLCVRID